MRMKTIAKLFPAAAIAMAVVSCASSEATRISGIAPEGIDSVYVTVPQMDVDTLVPVTGGKFNLTLPVDETVAGVVEAGNYKVRFIPDGSKITVTLSEEKCTAESKGNGAQAALDGFIAFEEELSGRLNEEFDAIRQDTTLTETEASARLDGIYDEIIGEFVGKGLETIASNPDNFVAVYAFSEISSNLEDEQIDSVLNTLGPKISDNPQIVRVKKELQSKKTTAEGCMFTDFIIPDSDGKSVSFSEYIGKGKYVLVDFWASWCGPCKREIPNIRDVYKKYKGAKFDVLSIAVWDKPEDTKKAAAEHGVIWNQIINAQTIPTEIYGIQGIPQIMLFGPDGTILKRDLRGEGIETAVKEALGK